jgi:hypothetical protein
VEVINEYDAPMEMLVDLLILLGMVDQGLLNDRNKVALGNAILGLNDLSPFAFDSQCILLRLCQRIHLS